MNKNRKIKQLIARIKEGTWRRRYDFAESGCTTSKTGAKST
jgi:hypothetical protein